MLPLFPEPIQKLPLADIRLPGVTAYLSQAEDHQVIFFAFDQDVDLPEHSHAAQWGVVLEGQIDLTIEGQSVSYHKGDRYFIPEGVLHAAKIYAGYSDITFFAQADRYAVKGLVA